MEIKGIDAEQFGRIVAQVAERWYDSNIQFADTPRRLSKNRFRVRLRATSSRGKGARRSWSGRRSVAACWHVFRDVVRETMSEYPDAVFRTAMARYTAENFEHTYPATGHVNIGSMMQPAYMPDLCDCRDYE